MISKNQLKLIRALGQKKYRKQYNQYLVQGEKNVLELLNSGLSIAHIFATPAFISAHQTALAAHQVIEADEDSLTKASTLVSNNAAIAVVDMPSQQTLPTSGLILALDGVSIRVIWARLFVLLTGMVLSILLPAQTVPMLITRKPSAQQWAHLLV